MKIESSNISFQSQHDLLEVNQKQENLQFWIGDNPSAEVSGPPWVTIDISEKGLELQKSLGSNGTQYVEDDLEDMLSEKDKQKLKLIEAMMEYFLGRKVKLVLPKRIKISQEAQPNLVRESPRVGWGLIFDSQISHYESEKVSFQSKGIVKTSDEKEIKIDLQLNMSREFYTSQSIHVRAGDAIRKDPLVINFDAPATKLSNSKFSFDIDCDGDSDQISQLRAGSGFLSLDLNGDGKVNDGSELFGPKSGDGFSDLSLYDGDKNGWIDENDAIFDKLRIWTMDEHGNDTLFALGQKGIGAICLGSAATPFSLKGAENIENGVIQKTGIFLRENGLAGTIQHVDLAV
jgi:hypothetical protein